MTPPASSAAAIYDAYWTGVERAQEGDDPDTGLRWQLLDKAVPMRHGLRVLDVGCGFGALVGRLRARGQAADGLEISARAVDEARDRFPDAEFQVADAGQGAWPVADAVYEVVISFEVVEHLMEPRTFFREAARVCAPGGLLVLTTPYHGVVKNLVLALRGYDRHYDVNGAHIRFFSVRSLRREATDAGFTVRSMRLYGRVRPLARGMFLVAERAGRTDVTAPGA